MKRTLTIHLPEGKTIRTGAERYRLTEPVDVPADKLEAVAVQPTRMLKCKCSGCGYTCRVTARWLSKGTPICPVCAINMMRESTAPEPVRMPEPEPSSEPVRMPEPSSEPPVRMPEAESELSRLLAELEDK